MKLLVVHLTTIYAFCHLLRIRGEAIFSMKLIFYILTPLASLMEHGLALLAIGLSSLLNLSKGGRRKRLYRALRLLFGVARPTRDVYVPLSTTEPAETSADSKTQRSCRSLGHVFMVLAFLVQCIGTMVLYHHRRQHNSLTAVDERVFDLGCSGLLTGVLTLGLELGLPPFAVSAADADDDSETEFDKFVLILRGKAIQPIIHPHDDDFKYAVFWEKAFVSFLTLLALKKIKLPWMYKELPSDMEDGTLFLQLVTTIWPALTGGGVGGFWVAAFVVRDLWKDVGKWVRVFLLVISPMIALIASPFTAAVGIILLSPLTLIFYCIVESSKTLGQILDLSAWPTNIPCSPLLWNDPQANWIWWLA